MSFTQCSIMKKITQAEESIKECYTRVNALEGALKESNSDEDQKNALSKDLEEARKLLATNEQLLKEMHRENRTSFYFVATFLSLFVLLYLVYMLLFDDPYAHLK